MQRWLSWLAVVLAMTAALCSACGDDGDGADAAGTDGAADSASDADSGEPADATSDDGGPQADDVGDGTSMGPDGGPVSDAAPGDTAPDANTPVEGTDGADAESDAIAPLDCVPEIQLGAHPLGETDITTFVPYVGGDELCVELGTQGFLMVVYGFQTRCGIDEPFSLCVDIQLEGEVLGDVCLKKQKWTGSDDDWNYYMNIFLVVASSLDEFKDANAYYGETATVSVSIEDDEGHAVAGSADVVMIDCWGACQIPED